MPRNTALALDHHQLKGTQSKMAQSTRTTTHTSTPTPRASAQPSRRLRVASAAVRALVAARPAFFRRLAQLAAGAALMLAAAIPASATTPLSACTVITTGGDYVLTTSIPTSGTQDRCIEVTGNSTAVNLDCDFNGITSPYTALYVHDINADVSIYHCTSMGNLNDGYRVVDIDCNGHSFVMTVSGAYTAAYPGNSVFEIYRCNAPTIYGSAFPNVAFFIQDSPSISLVSNTITSIDPSCVVCFQNSNNVDLEYNTITGSSGTDDVIVHNGTGGYYYGNNLTGGYDCAIEQTGASSNLYIQANSLNSPKGFCSFGPSFGGSIYNLNFAANTHSGSIGMLVIRGSYGSLSFTDSYITGNSGTGTDIEITGRQNNSQTWFGTVSNIYMWNNAFGANTVNFGTSGGITDAGSNYCSAAYLPEITCH